MMAWNHYLHMTDTTVPTESGPSAVTACTQVDLATGRILLSVASNTAEGHNLVVIDQAECPQQIYTCVQ